MAEGGGERSGGGSSCGIHLTREGYYTSPPFHQLKNYTNCGVYTVEKLTIGRSGFGSITFDNPINIKDLNFDDIVQINHKEVVVYPDEEQKPPTGHGLNCAAEVRLEKVWPYDSYASKYITDAQALEEICFIEKLKETNQKCSTTFLNYIPESGSWIFKVEHFSKYGLYDTDDEGDEKGDKKELTAKHGKEKPQKQVIHAKQAAADLNLKGAEEFSPLALNGVNGINGVNGVNGINGFNGVNGLNEINGIDGIEITGIDGINGIEIDGIRIDGIGIDGLDAMDTVNGANGVNGVNGVNGINGSLQTNPESSESEFTPERLQFINHDDEDDVIMKEAYPTSSEIVTHITDTWLKPFCLENGLGVSRDKIMSMKQAFFPEEKESGGDGGGDVEFDEDDDEDDEDDDEDDDVDYDDYVSEEGPFVKSVGTPMRIKSPLKVHDSVSTPKPLHIFPKLNLHLEHEYSAKKMRTSKTKTQLPYFEESPRPKGTLLQRPSLKSVSGLIKTATIFPQMKVPGRNVFETSTYKYPNHIVPLRETSTNKVKSRSLRDLDLYKGHGFRVGWAPGGVLLILTTQKSASTVALEAEVHDLDKYLKGRSDDDNSKQIVQRICLRGGRGLAREASRASYENELREYLGSHLKVKLKQSEFYEDQNIPGIKPIPGSATVTLHDSLRLKDDCRERVYPYNVWSLCEALWGELPEYVPPINSHHNLMLRKQYLGDWLTFVYRNTLLNQHDGKLYSPKAGDDSYLEEIWNLVTGNMIKDACNLARKNGDTFMVTMLTQLASSQFVNHLMREQVNSWITINADGLVKRDRLKLYLLLCGLPLFNANDETVNVCERLDWKRTLGLHLWYLTSNIKTIKDAFTAYQKAFRPKDFSNLYAKAPFPPYCEEGYIYDLEEKLPPLDLCYHLIYLYCDRFYSMAKIFDPVTHTLDVLDYSLSWLVYISLHAIGYHHTSEYGAAHVHSSFAAQLESYGMWEWAVFVLLHIPDNNRRQMAIIRLLERNLCSVGDNEYKKKECFVKYKLKIPASWIYEIKAHKSIGQARYHFATCYLNKAGQFNYAHKILMKHLAPQYVVNERYKELIKLLRPLAIECKKENPVYNWEKGGYVIWLYLKVMTKINHMLKHPEDVDGYQLESVQVDAISLCKLLPEFIVNTQMDRLCRIDLCDRLFDLVGEFVKLQRDDQMSCRILLFMTTKLPMPDNFKILERRNFIENWPADFANCRLFT